MLLPKYSHTLPSPSSGGLGVIGGVGYTPKMLRSQIKVLKDDLKDKSAPFGVDLLLPQIGGSARKTNVSLMHVFGGLASHHSSPFYSTITPKDT